MTNYFYGTLDLVWWQYIVVGLVFTHITIAAVTIFLHRCQAHRALTLHPIVSHFFRLWLWLSTGMETKAWVAIHRKHHSKCETPEDPHSPQVMGLGTVMWWGAELYRKESQMPETLERYGKGTPDDWLERTLYEKRSAKGVVLMLITNLILFGAPGLAIWALQMAWIPFWAAGIVNGVGHYWGYRNFECPDAATNVSPWGILIGGEELHNNHHSYPASAKLSVKPWEFDIGWLYIKLLSYAGLAKIGRTIPKLTSIAGKNVIDGATLEAMIPNRFQIMAKYTKQVMLPMLHQVQAAASVQEREIIRKSRSALIRTESLIKPISKKYLGELLNSNSKVQLIYNFKQQLLEIWDSTAASQKELLDALHKWCLEAEGSGVRALQEFTRYLRGYAVV